MTSVDLYFGTVFLLQIVIGTLGNFSLLCHCTFLHFSGCRLRTTGVILRHLAVANSLVILSRGVPEAMTAFGLKNLSDLGCKLVFYAHRVGRGVSMGSTCLLSVSQAITISPQNSRWAQLKGRAPRCISTSNILCWVLHLLLDASISLLFTNKLTTKNITKAIDFQYCSARLPDRSTSAVNAVLSYFHDILCLGLMIWASSSMIFILYRHQQRIHHIHSRNISLSASPVTRASQSILVLVSVFVSFYSLSSILHGLFYLYGKTVRWLVKTSALMNSCFAAASPFILMNRECGVSRPTWKQ
ncbi:vomeronasal type-1 receptor 2-like [Ctenodactylus gundi]